MFAIGRAQSDEPSDMSADLEQARTDFEQGSNKRAVHRLWHVEARARVDLREAQGLLVLARSIGERTDGRLRRDCEQLVS